MKKILFVASTASHILNFHIPYIKYFKDIGCEVHVAIPENENIPFVDKVHKVEFTKNMFSYKNIIAIKQMKIVLQKEKYHIVSMHTTLASFIVRVAKALIKNDIAKYINTSHGYLFYKNRNKLIFALYFIVEYILAFITDDIITMNKEDYDISKKYFKCKGRVYFIKGMGLKNSIFPKVDNKDLKKSKINMGLDEDSIILIYSGEFSNRKNQIFLIENIEKTLTEFNKIQLVLLGDGKNFEKCKREIKKRSLEEKIICKGYVDNVYDYLIGSDIVISSSKSEGLPFNIMEGMLMGRPVIASKVKGHEDLIIDGKNGYLFELKDKNEFNNKLKILLKDKNLRLEMGYNNKHMIKEYLLENVFYETIKVYDNYIDGKDSIDRK